jgi:photosystem II stability/assembly factor-like uncharacterized protein
VQLLYAIESLDFGLSRTSLTRTCIVVALLFLFLDRASAQITPPVSSFQQITANTGWVANDGGLYWTSDAGRTWKDISPPYMHLKLISTPVSLKDAFFIDVLNGWALLSDWGDHADAPEVTLAYTKNGGIDWTTDRIVVPDVDADSLDGYGNLFFLDHNIGWLDLGLTSSSNFNSGILFKTIDGGKSWKHVRDDPWIAAEIFFKNTEDGWIAGGPGDQDLFVSHDGGETWKKTILNAPDNIDANSFAAPTLPIFIGETGFVPVTYAQPHEKNGLVVVYSTSDSGKSWHEVLTLPLSHGVSGGRQPIGIIKSTNGSVTPILAETAFGLGALKVKFIDNLEGWASTWQGLLRTSDGGATWTDVSPFKHRVPESPQEKFKP